MGLPDGALVGTVEPGTAAARTGLREGDVITRLDDHLISDADTLVATVRSYRPGDTATLTVTSSTADGTSTGAPRAIQIKLGSDAS